MSVHPLYVPVHLLALAVLIAGEVRAYPSHKRVSRAVGIPLAFMLVPVMAKIGPLVVGLPGLVFAVGGFFSLGWPLVGLVWGTLQLLRHPASGVVRSEEPVSEGVTEKPGQLPPARDVPVSLKVARALLFGGGLLGAVACLMALVLGLIANHAFGGLRSSDVWLWVALFVNFCSYPWVVWRAWPAGWLLIWGVLVHMHLVHWLPQVHETADVLPVVGVLLLGLLTYSVYTWLVWKQEHAPTD